MRVTAVRVPVHLVKLSLAMVQAEEGENTVYWPLETLMQAVVMKEPGVMWRNRVVWRKKPGVMLKKKL